MIASGQLAPELGDRLHRGVDFPGESLLGRGQSRDDFSEAYLPDNEDVNITAALERSACGGAVNECNADSGEQRQQGIPQDIADGGRLGHEPEKLVELRPRLMRNPEPGTRIVSHQFAMASGCPARH